MSWWPVVPPPQISAQDHIPGLHAGADEQKKTQNQQGHYESP